MRSPRALSVACPFHVDSGKSIFPAAPVHNTATAPSRAEAVEASSFASAGLTSISKRFFNCSQAAFALSMLRDVTVTSAPSPAKKAAARSPTGPVPARTTTFLPLTSTTPASFATAAAAVVLQPFESSITEFLTGPKKAPFTASMTASPFATSEPPTKTALFFILSPPRVNMTPCTSGTAFSGVIEACWRITSAPPS